MKKKTSGHIVLSTHPTKYGPKLTLVNWGAATAVERGPVIATVTEPAHRNCIGTHSGAYSIYRALAVASGSLDPEHRADLTNTAPTNQIGPFSGWFDPKKIVSLDPWGAMVGEVFKKWIDDRVNIQPTIAVTRAHIQMPEFADEIRAGRMKPDGKILLDDGHCVVTKMAIEPVWFLPGVAERFEVDEMELRRVLFQQTGGMFTELVTRTDLQVFLPPIGGATIYIFGDLADVSDPTKELSARVHDECNGSDVFGSDICTCRPYLVHGIEECIKSAQKGGAGVIVYNRKEGRALGEVTKFLVYNARKRQEGGDRADTYFHRTECVAGVQDMRFQELMPDPLHWLGISKIDHFISMSDMKHDAIVKSGIKIIERVPIPDQMIPQDARVEMEAKMAAGYFTKGKILNSEGLAEVKGRKFEE